MWGHKEKANYSGFQIGEIVKYKNLLGQYQNGKIISFKNSDTAIIEAENGITIERRIDKIYKAK